MIHILTPIRKGEQLACDVSKQTVPCKQFTHSCDLENRRDNEAYNRNQLKQYASEPYTCLLDADVILPDNALEKMAAFLDKHPFPAVAIDTKQRRETELCNDTEVGHTIIACMLFRKKVLDMITFGPLNLTYNHPDLAADVYLRVILPRRWCCCVTVNAQIRTMTGYPIPYLRGIAGKESQSYKGGCCES